MHYSMCTYTCYSLSSQPINHQIFAADSRIGLC